MYATRTPIDNNVWWFWPIVYNTPIGTVDEDQGASQETAVDRGIVYVLDGYNDLWLESGRFSVGEPVATRLLVDQNVAIACPIDTNTCFVCDNDSNLWLEYGPFGDGANVKIPVDG
uniref:hypothetical protein n=1 Tax=Mycobacterium sp. TaxID=1785 RepID=UPI003F9C3B10